MTKHILISIVGFFVFSIAGIAAASAITHPEEVTELRNQAVQAVQTVQSVIGVSDDTSASSNDSDASEKEVEQVFRGDNGGVRASSDDGDNGDDEDESDDEDEDYDDSSERGEGVHRSGAAQTTTQPVPTQATTQALTLALVATHNNVSSCYTVVNGSVYDVTTWITQHPGGKSAIKAMCGVDASASFNGQHGGQSRPESELAGFKIGTLVQ